MPIANTVEANIVVNFEDRLTGPAQKAFEQFRRHAESTFRAVSAAGVAAFEQIRVAQENFLKFSNNFFIGGTNSFFEGLKNVLTALALISLPLKNIRENFNLLLRGLRFVITAFSSLRLALPLIAAGISLLAPVLAPAALLFANVAAAAGLLFLAWKGLQALGEITVAGKPIRQYLQDTFAFFIAAVKSLPGRIFELKDQMLEAGRQLFESFSQGLLSKINAAKTRFLDFVRSIGGQARMIAEEAVRSVAIFGGGPLRGPGGLIPINDNPLGLNLEPQFGPSSSIPSFASGIRFVPRDMLARIHQGETVLPRKQAEQFREGRLSRVSVGSLHINLNNNAEVSRQEARRLARMIREELQRVDERMAV